MRFLPTPPNFAPVAAMAMFAGAYFADKRIALLIPIMIMVLTDLVLGFHSLMWVVYLSFAAMVGIGTLVGRYKSFASITAGAIGGSILFFITTNFAVWASGGGVFYPLSAEGLLLCYTAALPFFHNTLIGDLFFTGVFFGGFELITRMVPTLQVKAIP
jgi:hypothetical protein